MTTATAILLLDLLLITSLLGLAIATLASPDPRRSVILFMAFGLVLALAWVRLRAPDIALAEAAIGAGLAGALMLAAVDELCGREKQQQQADRQGGQHGRFNRMLDATATLLCAATGALLAWSLAHALGQPPQDELRQTVFGELDNSGVSNPVTAVLLNFRAYDTLLELGVLLTALLGILAVGKEQPAYQAAGPVFDSLSRWLVPLLILAASYLLWVGAHAPGGAFQAGATLAAAGVVLRLAGHGDAGLPRGTALRLLMTAGVAVFVGVGLSLLLAGHPFLGYPQDWAGPLILFIESAAMLAIATTLVMAFIGGQTKKAHARLAKGEQPC